MARVLVVEDDLDLRALIEVRLTRCGHLVVAVGSSAAALEVLAGLGENEAPEIAVLDVLMPGLSGLDLLARLRADPAYAALPVIFLSGRVERGDIDAGEALGARYLTKPVSITALATAIDEALLVAAVDATW